MPFVVTQLTRMRDGHVCIAGIDPDTGRHVRPVLPDHQRFPAAVLSRNGGPYELGALVDLGLTRPQVNRPEIEDLVLLGQPTRIGELTPQDFWTLIDNAAHFTLNGIFGEAFGRRAKQACGTPEGQGDASLGVLRPERPVTLHMDERDGRVTIRARVPFDLECTRVPVTDVRLYEADCVTPSRVRVERMSAMLGAGAPVLLAMGLSRPYAFDGGEASHWLQVNGIFVDNGHLWRDGDDRG